jgi:hypothetical protein
MKRTLFATAAIAGLLFANALMAQEKTEETNKKKKAHTLKISNNGICLETTDGDSTVTIKTKDGKTEKKEEEKAGKFKTSFAMFDIGVNLLNDNTNYNDPTVVNYLNVPTNSRNESLFDLRPSKSINVNFTPIGVKFLAVKTKNQRLYMSTGLGIQIYNFRFEEDISYKKNPNGIILEDALNFRKNKLAVSYVNIPLILTGKTRMHKKTWLVYGAGVTAGYRMTTVNKQISNERGKVKTRGNFDLADFNTCLTAEFGVEGVLRFFASYQMNSLYDNGIDQRPICVGLRFGGN